MFAIIQFPISDLRGFYRHSNKLSRPRWPYPTPDIEHIRAFGPIRYRRRGGLNGWIGEALICDAHRIFKLNSCQPRLNSSYPFLLDKIVFRRFYFDGEAVGKLEIGMVFHSTSTQISAADFVTFLSTLELRSDSADSRGFNVSRFPKYLRKKYIAATTIPSDHSAQNDQLVISGRTSFYIEYDGFALKLPKYHFSVENAGQPFRNFKLHFWRQEIHGQQYPVWAAESNFYHASPVIARQLRIYLLRLHAENQALAQALNAIADNHLELQANTKQSDDIQRYISSAVKRIKRLKELTMNSANTDISSVATEIDYLSKPGQQDALLKQVEMWRPRPNIAKSISSLLSGVSTVVMPGGVMNHETNNNYGQAANVGSGGTVNNSTFNQQVIKGDDLSAKKFAEDLDTLLAQIKKMQLSSDQSIDVKLIETSKVSAENSDLKTAVGYLKRCGTWAAEVSKDVGVQLIAEAIKGNIVF